MTSLAPTRARTRAESAEVLYALDEPIVIGTADLAALKTAAAASPRRRARLCTHAGPDAPLHEMLIALCRDSYVRPHRHRGKTESFSVLEGAVDVILFHDDGTVREVIPMGPPGSGRAFYHRLAQPVYHTVIVRSAIAVFHEVTNGPFRTADTSYAPWAPGDDDRVAARAYLESLPPA